MNFVVVAAAAAAAVVEVGVLTIKKEHMLLSMMIFLWSVEKREIGRFKLFSTKISIRNESVDICFNSLKT